MNRTLKYTLSAVGAFALASYIDMARIVTTDYEGKVKDLDQIEKNANVTFTGSAKWECGQQLARFHKAQKFTAKNPDGEEYKGIICPALFSSTKIHLEQ